ncbi:MAG: DEAD/DEAH box helicase [Candidatus Hodarchaeales archaeon]
MTVQEKQEQSLRDKYYSSLEEFEETRDVESLIDQVRELLSDDQISRDQISILREIAKHFTRLKQYQVVKEIFGKILQIDTNNRQTWKDLSSLYFKLKDVRKGEFCMKKYYSLAGGNAELQKATKARLAAIGRLKKIPKDRKTGLGSGTEYKSTVPKGIMDISKFTQLFNVTERELPEAIKRIVRFNQHQIVDYRLFEAQEGEYGIQIKDIDSRLSDYYSKKGITRLYKFQEEAYNAIINSNDVCIVAPTGNGKTEAFLIPSLLKIQKYKDFGVQLLLIYPMKALAKDQLRKIEELAEVLDLTVKVFDGDTSHYWRKKIFKDPPEILISNPDILHYHLGVGKNSERFQDLLSSLKIVILDEIHSYSGTFGSNMFFILKRLERVVNNKIQLIGSSATIANADSFVSGLFDREIEVIKCKKGSRGRLHFLILAPYPGVSTSDSLVMLVNSIRSLGKMLVFQDSHKAVESLFQRLGSDYRRIGIHRAGLDKKIREEVEKNFREGSLELLLATPTLELGIDIGDLDMVVTPPISVNRAMQRIGRAGRRGQDAIAIVHLKADDPISQYYYDNPNQYYQDIEDVFFDAENPNVLEHQLLCLAMDRPISLDPYEFPGYARALSRMIKEGLFLAIDETLLVPSDQGRDKVKKYSIRGRNHEVLIRIHGGKVIGKRSMPLAMFELYPGAYYSAAGTRYRVTNFWFNGFRGGADLVRLSKNKWGSTYPLTSMKPEIVEIFERYNVNGLEIAYVEAKILWSVYGYTLDTNQGSGAHRLNDPLFYSSRSKGLLFKVPSITSAIAFRDINTFEASLHALVHVILHASLPFIGGQLNEINGLALLPSGHILLFDQETGSGVCAMLIDHLDELLKRSYKILQCKCKDPRGCPKCTFLVRCSNNNNKLDKHGAKALVKILLDSTISKPLGDDFDFFSKTLH